jgi:hypothetical protein
MDRVLASSASTGALLSSYPLIDVGYLDLRPQSVGHVDLAGHAVPASSYDNLTALATRAVER